MTDDRPDTPSFEDVDAADAEAPGPAPTSYEAASERLEEIIKRLDSGAAGLRETLDLVQEGRTLVAYCASELEAVGKGLDELRLDDLIARLETSRTGDPD